MYLLCFFRFLMLLIDFGTEASFAYTIVSTGQLGSLISYLWTPLFYIIRYRNYEIRNLRPRIFQILGLSLIPDLKFWLLRDESMYKLSLCAESFIVRPIDRSEHIIRFMFHGRQFSKIIILYRKCANPWTSDNKVTGSPLFDSWVGGSTWSCCKLQQDPCDSVPSPYLNICSISSWQIGLIPFSVRTRIAFSLSATRKTINALFAFLARNA